MYVNRQSEIADLLTAVRRWTRPGRIDKNRAKLNELFKQLNDFALPECCFILEGNGRIHFIMAALPWCFNGSYIDTRVDVSWNYDPVSFVLTCVKSRDGRFLYVRKIAPIPALSLDAIAARKVLP
jgi:hypothetical protein